MKYKKSVYQTLALISQLGFSIIIPILLCTLGGVYLEDKFSVPITIPLIVAGVLAGIRNAYYLLREAIKTPEAKDETEG